MKYINKILSLFVIALIATSCDPDAESYTPGELGDGNQGICFVCNYTQTVEVEDLYKRQQQRSLLLQVQPL